MRSLPLVALVGSAGILCAAALAVGAWPAALAVACQTAAIVAAFRSTRT